MQVTITAVIVCKSCRTILPVTSYLTLFSGEKKIRLRLKKCSVRCPRRGICYGVVWRDRREAEGPHLLPLPDALVDKLGERRARDEAARPGRHRQLPALVRHLPPGDGDHGDAMAHHALEDVVVHRLVVRAGRDGPVVSREHPDTIRTEGEGGPMRLGWFQSGRVPVLVLFSV